MKKVLWFQFFVLLVGTLFAWGNFIVEFYSWYGFVEPVCIVGTCGASRGVSPFLGSCFYGAIVFTIAFVLHMIILKRTKK